MAVIKGKFWVNKVGTYGVDSAQLCWGRLAALVIRMLYEIFPWAEWQLVYVDDFAWSLRQDSARRLSLAILACLTAVGVPLSWKKCELGSHIKWLGFNLDCNGPALQIPKISFSSFLDSFKMLIT